MERTINHIGVIRHLYQLPALYSQDGKGDDQKVYTLRLVYEPYKTVNLGSWEPTFEWFLSEYDQETHTAFGYANLNDPVNSELGYMYMPELLKLGVQVDLTYKPLSLKEIKARVYGTEE